MIQLQDALARGNLPSLTHLCFESCRSGLDGNLSLVLLSFWPSLTYLNLCQCQCHLCFLWPQKKGFLPELHTLLVSDVCVECETLIPNLFIHCWMDLRIFCVDHVTRSNYSARKFNGIFKTRQTLKLERVRFVLSREDNSRNQSSRHFSICSKFKTLYT